jgi:hypothetical protein
LMDWSLLLSEVINFNFTFIIYHLSFAISKNKNTS